MLHRIFEQRLAGLRATLEGTSWWPPVAGFLVALRPVWWVARAWAAVAVVSAVLGVGWGPSGLLGFLLLLAAVAIFARVKSGSSSAAKEEEPAAAQSPGGNT